MKVITRFAPSPTGMLHIGNARTAIINWLYAKKHNGSFILRFDDTDLERSKQEYKDAIEKDLRWLGLRWDQSFAQSSRLSRYEEIKEALLQKGRLYPCFESPEELEVKRKLQLSNGKPPIYDRSSLLLTKEQIDRYKEQGRKPHYRFLIEDKPIHWSDMIKGELKYMGGHLSDPIVIREDETMTYMLCSCIDDVDYKVTDILRGEDHVTNTAIQIQMFEALSAKAPNFGHLSLVKAKDEKISKRVGGFAIDSLRADMGLEAMAVNSFFCLIGSSKPIMPYKNLDDLIREFDVSNFSQSPMTYQSEDLERLNHKLLINLDYEEIKDRLKELNMVKVNEQFWLAVRPNLRKLAEIKDWWKICYESEIVAGLDKEFLAQALNAMPNEPITKQTWSIWTNKVAEITGKKGKELFMPLRLAITGMDHGPEMTNILPLIDKEEIIRRLVR
jgi:glutamyl-tRNA synthetase